MKILVVALFVTSASLSAQATAAPCSKLVRMAGPVTTQTGSTFRVTAAVTPLNAQDEIHYTVTVFNPPSNTTSHPVRQSFVLTGNGIGKPGQVLLVQRNEFYRIPAQQIYYDKAPSQQGTYVVITGCTSEQTSINKSLSGW